MAVVGQGIEGEVGARFAYILLKVCMQPGSSALAVRIRDEALTHMNILPVGLAICSRGTMLEAFILSPVSC